PPRALGVDVPQPRLTQRIHVRQAAHVTKLHFGLNFNRAQTDQNTARRPEAECPRLVEELSVVDRQSGLRAGGNPREVTVDLIDAVDADEVPSKWREPHAREVEALPTLDAPVRVVVELREERRVRGANGAYLDELGRTSREHEVGRRLDARIRAVA